MSARRQARAHTARLSSPTAGSDDSGVPHALRIGRCIEVWCERPAADPLHVSQIGSARSRFSLARDAWGEVIGADDRELQRLVPHGSPWSFDGAAGPQRLRRLGFSRADLDWLRGQATDLLRGASASDARRTEEIPA